MRHLDQNTGHVYFTREYNKYGLGEELLFPIKRNTENLSDNQKETTLGISLKSIRNLKKGLLNFCKKLKSAAYLRLHLEITESHIRIEKNTESKEILVRKSSGSSITITGKEKKSFKKFLGRSKATNVDLERLLGVGGEGIVVEKPGQQAMKFVKIRKAGGFGNGNFHDAEKSERQMKELGDFVAANMNTNGSSGYTKAYVDFGISKIHGYFYFVIGYYRS